MSRCERRRLNPSASTPRNKRAHSRDFRFRHSRGGTRCEPTKDGRPSLSFATFPTPQYASVFIRPRAPDLGVFGLFTTGALGATAEVDEPRCSRYICDCRCRPIDGRLEVAKGMAWREGRPRRWHGRINQARQFRHRREPLAFASASRAARAPDPRRRYPTPRVGARWRLLPH